MDLPQRVHYRVAKEVYRSAIAVTGCLLAFGCSGGTTGVALNRPGQPGSVSTTSSAVLPVRSLSGKLLQASSIGPGWQSGGVVTDSNTSSMTPCASALWAIYNKHDYPARSQENFGDIVTNGIPLWSTVLRSKMPPIH